MPSPFPGMNPYLEQKDVWEDFHHALLPAIRDYLSPQASPKYIVKLSEQLYVHELDPDEYRLVGKSDVSLSALSSARETTAATGAVEAPKRIRLLVTVDEVSQTRVEILDRKSRELVTIIEVLSPSNKKSGGDRDQYCSKRAQILRSWVNFVEIDLLRGWPRMRADNMVPCDYCIIVSRHEERPEAELWPVLLKESLPEIPVPLRTPDPAAKLDLQALVHQIYDRAFYENYIYDGQPEPRLTAEQQEWAKQFLPAGGG